MDVFVARQPIFDRGRNVHGYELLYRSGLENACRAADLDRAASKVIADTLHLHGFETIAAGRKAFVNVTQDVLLRDYPAALPPASTVIELLETVSAAPEVLDACRRLKAAGYELALDDYAERPGYEELVSLADLVKVDFQAVAEDERASIVGRLAPRGVRTVAERIETPETFEEASRSGYDYFQGYFFARPAILVAKDIPSSKLSMFRILQEIHRADLDFAKIERIVKQDVGLCYKFLRYINSAWFGLRERILSIRRALVLLGEREVRRWVSLVAVAGMSEDKPQELLVQALTRARFCELLATPAGIPRRAEELFLVGMLSVMDAVLDRPLPSLIADLPLSSDAADALLGKPCVMGSVLASVLAYERGSWDEFAARAAEAGIAEALCPGLYLDALEWSGRASAARVAA